jgi:hypothetical protein
MRPLIAGAAALALMVAFAADGFANPKVKFSEDSTATVDDNHVLSHNTLGDGEPDGTTGSINTGDVNFESFNSDVEVITNKELDINVSDINLDWTGGDGAPGTNDTNTWTLDCTEGECTWTITTDVSGTPTGGNGGSPHIYTGPVAITLGPCQGFCNVIGNTGFANANVAETAATFHVTIGGGVSSTPGGG